MICYKCGTEISRDDYFICPKCKTDNAFREETIRTAAAGDSAAFEELYQRSCASVRTTVRGIIRNEADVEDIVQDAYVKAYQSLGTLSKAEGFRTWICTIARNKALDYMRKNRPVVFADMAADNEDGDTFEYDLPETDVDRLPEAHYDREEMHRLLFDELLGALPDEQRVAVTLVLLEEKTEREAAEILGISQNTLKSRIRYGRKKLLEKGNELKKKGVSFFGLTTIPFTAYLYRRLMLMPSDEDLSGAAAAARKAATAARMTAGAGGTAAAGTAKTGLTMTVKLAIGGLSAVLVIGGTLIGASILNREKRNEDTVFSSFENETNETMQLSSDAPSGDEEGAETLSEGSSMDEEESGSSDRDTEGEEYEGADRGTSETPSEAPQSEESESSGNTPSPAVQPEPDQQEEEPSEVPSGEEEQEERSSSSEEEGEKRSSSSEDDTEPEESSTSSEESEPETKEFWAEDVVFENRESAHQAYAGEPVNETVTLDISSLSQPVRVEISGNASGIPTGCRLTYAGDGSYTIQYSSPKTSDSINFTLNFRDGEDGAISYNVSYTFKSYLAEADNMDAKLPHIGPAFADYADCVILSSANYASVKSQFSEYESFLNAHKDALEQENGAGWVDLMLSSRNGPGNYGYGMTEIEKYEQYRMGLDPVIYTVRISAGEGTTYGYPSASVTAVSGTLETRDVYTEKEVIHTVYSYGSNSVQLTAVIRYDSMILTGVRDAAGNVYTTIVKDEWTADNIDNYIVSLDCSNPADQVYTAIWE